MSQTLVHTSNPKLHDNQNNRYRQQCGDQSRDACLLLGLQQHSSRGRTERLYHFFPKQNYGKQYWTKTSAHNPITEVKMITLTHTKFSAKQNLQFNSYIVKLQIFHRLKIFERSDKINIMKEGMQIKQNIVKKLKWWTWKALEIISSWRATWFRQL